METGLFYSISFYIHYFFQSGGQLFCNISSHIKPAFILWEFFFFLLLLRGRLDISAVCAYSMASIQEAFSKGSYRGPVTVEHSHVRWMVFRGEVPVPRPGAVNTTLLVLIKQ